MVIDFLTSASVWGDAHRQEDFAMMQDHNKHTDRLNYHEGRLNEQWNDLERHGKLIDEDRKNINGNSEWIRGLEAKVEKMRQTLRETLDELLKKMLVPKLEAGANVVEGLRKERDAVSAQLAELKRQREEMKVELERMRNLCDETKKTFEEQLKGLGGQLAEVKSLGQEMKDDFSMQVAEFKRSVPMPKKFAKFLFVQPETSIEKKD